MKNVHQGFSSFWIMRMHRTFVRTDSGLLATNTVVCCSLWGLPSAAT